MQEDLYFVSSLFDYVSSFWKKRKKLYDAVLIMPLCVCRCLLSWTPSVSSCGWLTGGPNMQSISSLEMIPHCFWLDLALNPIFPIWRWHLFQIYWGLRFVESGGWSHFGAIIPGGGRTEFKKKLHSSISSKFEFKQSNSTQSLSSVLLVSKKMLILTWI